MRSKNPRVLRFVVLCALPMVWLSSACSDDAAPKNDAGWMLNNAAQPDQGQPRQDMTGPSDMAGPTPDQGPRPDMTSPSPDMPPPPPPVDLGAPDMAQTPDMQPPPPPPPPGGCSRNSECARSEVCCLGLAGDATCTPENQCAGGFFDGLCVDASDCGAGEQCCDGNQLTNNRKFCSNRGCGVTPPPPPPGPSCTTNAGCPNAQRCCPSLGQQGMGQCQDMCQFNGGLCAADAECGMQSCCTLMALGQSVQLCLDRCP